MANACKDKYSLLEANVVAMIMCQFNESVEAQKSTVAIKMMSHTVQKRQYKSLANLEGTQLLNETKQLHHRKCFKPFLKENLTSTERNRVLESLIILTENKDGIIKA